MLGSRATPASHKLILSDVPLQVFLDCLHFCEVVAVTLLINCSLASICVLCLSEARGWIIWFYRLEKQHWGGGGGGAERRGHADAAGQSLSSLKWKKERKFFQILLWTHFFREFQRRKLTFFFWTWAGFQLSWIFPTWSVVMLLGYCI